METYWKLMKIWYNRSNKWFDDMPPVGQVCLLVGAGLMCGVIWFPLIIPLLAWRVYYLATKNKG